MRAVTIAFVFVATLVLMPARADETRSLPLGGASPKAAIADAAWLAGRWVGESESLRPFFDLGKPTLAMLLVVYGFVASVLPVWLLLAPRDYLSTFMKIGTIAALAIAIVMKQNGNTGPAKTGPEPSMKAVSAGSCTGGCAIASPSASSATVPSFTKAER